MERISLLASVAALSSLIAAAVLLVARAVAVRFDLAAPSVNEILEATNVSKSRAYEIAARLVALAPSLVRDAGRPEKERLPPAPKTPADDVTRKVLEYVMRNPGCVDRSVRHRYSRDFRLFVVGLCDASEDLDHEQMADAITVPIGTLKDWLRVPRVPPTATGTTPSASADESDAHPQTPQIQAVIAAWRTWRGSFVDFCAHVQGELEIPFGRDLVRRILETEGLRHTARRAGRSPDERALRDSFQTYFPGAQWVGDGMLVPVRFGAHRFGFNVELNVDTHTAAFVGLSIRDAEDSQAVIDAFEHGVHTTGTPPLGLLLDNRPSNHTPEVDAALGDTIRMRATVERPQNKAHVEGAFGLFSQALPPIDLDIGGAARECARRLLALVVEVWAKTTNHRPRSTRNGRSRAQLYLEGEPTDLDIANARRDLRDIVARQERARRTLEARRRPEVLRLLDAEFKRFDLLDPERHIRVAIAGYPLAAIVDGLIIFETKRRVNTLPDGVDARYLLGIVKNTAAKTEGEMLAEMLYDGRMKIQEQVLERLAGERDDLRRTKDTNAFLDECTDRFLDSPGVLTRTFWLETIVDTLKALPKDKRRAPYLRVTRRIEATFTIAPQLRHDLVRLVADKVVTIE